MEKLAIIEALKPFPERLAEEVAGLPEAVLSFRPAADEWSIKQVVGHVRFADEIWYRRLYSVWSLTDPVLMSFDGEAQALERAAAMSDLRPLLEELRASRPRIVDLLSHAVDWTRTGQWLGVGRRSLKQLAEYLLAHDAEHLAQVRRLKEAAAASGSRVSSTA